MDILDVIIVGGGPAGLNAAVVLGRCRRSVVVFDVGEHRNRYSHGLHNYLTRDDILPPDFIKRCYPEIEKYGVKLLNKKVVKAKKNGNNLFIVSDDEGNTYTSKKLLIATGVRDNVPEIPGFKELYGKSVFHCPYCDGWEVRDKKIGVYAKNKNGADLALALKGWSEHVVLYTDGRNNVKPVQFEQLEANEIRVDKRGISRIEGEGEQLKKIVFKNGEEEACDTIFFVNGYKPQCDLAAMFDPDMSHTGVVITNRFQQTDTPGLFVAGDADKDVQFVVVAAAEGAKAGVVINKELQKEIIKHQVAEIVNP